MPSIYPSIRLAMRITDEAIADDRFRSLPIDVTRLSRASERILSRARRNSTRSVISPSTPADRPIRVLTLPRCDIFKDGMILDATIAHPPTRCDARGDDSPRTMIEIARRITYKRVAMSCRDLFATRRHESSHTDIMRIINTQPRKKATDLGQPSSNFSTETRPILPTSAVCLSYIKQI